VYIYINTRICRSRRFNIISDLETTAAVPIWNTNVPLAFLLFFVHMYLIWFFTTTIKRRGVYRVYIKFVYMTILWSSSSSVLIGYFAVYSSPSHRQTSLYRLSEILSSDFNGKLIRPNTVKYYNIIM